jgi:hypothetical protein
MFFCSKPLFPSQSKAVTTSILCHDFMHLPRTMNFLFLITRHSSGMWTGSCTNLVFGLTDDFCHLSVFLTPHAFVLYLTELRAKHKMDLENLTLTKQPLRTLHFFMLAMLRYLKRFVSSIQSKGGLLVLLVVLVVAPGTILFASDGLNKKVCCNSF